MEIVSWLVGHIFNSAFIRFFCFANKTPTLARMLINMSSSRLNSVLYSRLLSDGNEAMNETKTIDAWQLTI